MKGPAAEVGTSRITDHLFAPANPREWWNRCGTCGLGCAAHVGTAVALSSSPPPPFRCPDCVMQEREHCVHQFMRESTR